MQSPPSLVSRHVPRADLGMPLDGRALDNGTHRTSASDPVWTTRLLPLKKDPASARLMSGEDRSNREHAWRGI